MNKVFEKIIEKLEERTYFLSDCTKYGNKDAEQQNKSYSTMMMYEVADLVDDLIDIVKQEAEQHEECYKYCRDCEAYNKEKHHCPKFCKVIKETVKEIEDNHNRWIPCSEPPENDRYVLLSFENFSVPMVGRYEEDENGGSYYIGDETEPCVTQDIFVNAWQPLPHPFQTKGE